MRIFIGGSARDEIPDKYKEEAYKLGEKLLKTDDEIYCCASNEGVIGSIYNLIKEQDITRVKTAVPKAHLKYADNENLTVITDTINERTDYVLKNCDMCIFLPGGIGTLYEIMSAIETKRANEHNSEIVIVNLYGFFDELLEMLEKIYTQNFASKDNKNAYKVVNNIDEINI